jgi:hypothetical protein
MPRRSLAGSGTGGRSCRQGRNAEDPRSLLRFSLERDSPIGQAVPLPGEAALQVLPEVAPEESGNAEPEVLIHVSELVGQKGKASRKAPCDHPRGRQREEDVAAEDESLRPQACGQQARDGAGVKSDAAKAFLEYRRNFLRGEGLKVHGSKGRTANGERRRAKNFSAQRWRPAARSGFTFAVRPTPFVWTLAQPPAPSAMAPAAFAAVPRSA